LSVADLIKAPKGKSELTRAQAKAVIIIALIVGVVFGVAAGWLSKPVERITERITEIVTVTTTIRPTPTPTPTPIPEHEIIENIEYDIKGFLEKTRLPLNFTTPNIDKILISFREIDEGVTQWMDQILLLDPRSNATFVKFYTLEELKELVPEERLHELYEFSEIFPSFLEKIVRPGDIVCNVSWSYLLERPFERLGTFIVDGETRKPIFDTMMFFVPVTSEIERITNSSTTLTNANITVDHQNSYGYVIYHEQMEVIGPFEIRPLDSNKSKFTLNLYDIRAERGNLIGFFYDAFSDVMVTMGFLEEGEIREGNNIAGKRLYSYLFIEGCGRFLPDEVLVKKAIGDDEGKISIDANESVVKIVNTGFYVKRGVFNLEGVILRDTAGPGTLSFKAAFILIDVSKQDPSSILVIAIEEKEESRKICD